MAENIYDYPKIVTNQKEELRRYLDQLAGRDPDFAKAYANPEKSIDECYVFIEKVVQRQATGGRATVRDEDVYGLAIHYYTEPNIKNIAAHSSTPSPAKAKKAVPPKLTEAEKAAAKEEAIREYKAAILAEEAKKHKEMTKKKPKSTQIVESPSLFDEF